MKFEELETTYYKFRELLHAVRERSDVLEQSWESYLHVEISLSQRWYKEDTPVDLYPLPLEIKEYAYLGIVKAVDTAVLRTLVNAVESNLDIIGEVVQRLPEGSFGREYDLGIINDYFSNGKVETGLWNLR